jgi:hypothetical protein
MGIACGMHGRCEKSLQNLVTECERKRPLRDLVIDGKIMS